MASAYKLWCNTSHSSKAKQQFYKNIYIYKNSKTKIRKFFLKDEESLKVSRISIDKQLVIGIFEDFL